VAFLDEGMVVSLDLSQPPPVTPRVQVRHTSTHTLHLGGAMHSGLKSQRGTLTFGVEADLNVVVTPTACSACLAWSRSRARRPPTSPCSPQVHTPTPHHNPCLIHVLPSGEGWTVKLP
jgi:hypothetical protein